MTNHIAAGYTQVHGAVWIKVRSGLVPLQRQLNVRKQMQPHLDRYVRLWYFLLTFGSTTTTFQL